MVRPPAAPIKVREGTFARLQDQTKLMGLELVDQASAGSTGPHDAEKAMLQKYCRALASLRNIVLITIPATSLAKSFIWIPHRGG